MKVRIEENEFPLQAFSVKVKVAQEILILIPGTKRGPWWKLWREVPVDYELFRGSLSAGETISYQPELGWTITPAMVDV